MNYKEKYNTALERARDLMTKQNPPAFDKDLISLVFPELKESRESEDERIMREILNVFKQLDEGTTICGRNYDYAKWIAWLEKQGDKKNTRKREIDDAYLQGICDTKHEIEKQGKQNPAWSEEDEQMILIIEQVMNCASLLNIVPEKIDNIKSWLKSIRLRSGGNLPKSNVKKLDADEVIAWINNQACCGYIEDIEVEKFVEQFKKYFKI